MGLDSPIDERWLTNEGELTDVEYADYVRQVNESEGFDMDALPLTLPGMITQSGCRSPNGILFAQLGLNYYNLINDADFEYVELDQHNMEIVKGIISYVTFKGKDAAGSIHIFQASIWEKLPGPNLEDFVEVLSCSLKPSKVVERLSQLEKQVIEKESQSEKRQKAETERDTKGKQVVLNVVKIVARIDNYHEWLGDGYVGDAIAYGYYCNQVLSSKGFDVDGDIPLMFPGQIIPLDTFDYSRNVIHVFSDIALSHYESTNLVNPCCFLDEIRKANAQTNLLELARTPHKAKHANFYITFVAKNKELGLTRTFQTLVCKRILEDGNLEIKTVSVKLLCTEICNSGVTKQ